MAPGPSSTSHQRELLRRLAVRVPAGEIDEIWIFPTCRVGATESTVAVVSSFHSDPQRRRVLTAHLSVPREVGPDAATPVADTLEENGIVPAERVAAVIGGLIGRLSVELAGPPTEARVAGDPARWEELLAAHDGDALGVPGPGLP